MAKIVFEDGELEDTLRYYNDWIGFELTMDQFMEILNDNNDLKVEVAFSGHDTVSREHFMNELGLRVTGKEWPIGMTSKEDTKLFLEEMKEKGHAMGYNIPDDFEEGW